MKIVEYPKLVRKAGKYHFKDENGNLSEGFEFAYVYFYGWARVQKKKDGPLQFRDIDGNLSEEFYWADISSEGWTVVQKKKDGPYQFRDIDGNLSEEFYEVQDCSKDFALVQKVQNGPWQFIDKNGNLSEEFFGADKYRDDFAWVQKKKDGPIQFRDKDGNLSEESFYYAYKYSGGFALVLKNGPKQYRDMLGRVTDEETKSGEDFYRFWRGRIKLENLDDEHFLDPIFYNGVIKEVKRRYLEHIDEMYSQYEEIDMEFYVEQAEKAVALINEKRQSATEKEKARHQVESVVEYDEDEFKKKIGEIFDKQLGKN